MGFVAKPEHAIAALTRDLDGRLAETNRGILRSSEDAYRQVIGRVTAQGLEGEFTRRGAAQAALNQFADRGITGFVDTAGKSWSLQSYTEMATRTGALNASRAGRLDSIRAAGNDLAIVSTSPSACPDCAEWEGKIISIDGVTPGYPTLADAEGAGHLFGPNCGHMADPYVEGVTVDTSAPSDPKLYEARQTQRGMERAIRGWKTRGAVALDDKTAVAAKAKVAEWQGKLRKYVAENDLKRLSYREQIPALRVESDVAWDKARADLASMETEQAVMRTSTGEILRGEMGTVTDAELSAAMRAQAKGATLLHNHPGWTRSFSQQDIVMAAHNRLGAIEVVTPDRTLFRAIPGARGWPAEDVVKKTWASVLERETGALDRIKGLSDAEWEKRLVEIERELNHTAMTQLHKDGWTVYTRGKLRQGVDWADPALRKAAAEWQRGYAGEEQLNHIKSASATIIAGGREPATAAGRYARALMDALDRSDYSGSLHRGMNNVPADTLAALRKVGSLHDLPLTSFSSDPSVANTFAHSFMNEGTEMVLRIEPEVGLRALPLEPAGDLQEVLSAGRFVVKSARRQGSRWIITLAQRR